jgi:hypothetical protein
MPVDELRRIKLKSDTLANFTAAQVEGLPAIMSDYAYRNAWYAGGAWRWGAPGDSAGSVKAYGVYSNFTDLRINPAGVGTLTGLSISALTNGKLPRPSVGSGLFTDSCFGDDGTDATITRPLTLNGATRQAWGASWKATQSLNGVAHGAIDTSGATSIWWAGCNFYHDGTNYRAVYSSTGVGYPARLALSGNGSISLVASQTDPIAGGIISDMASRWSVDRFGNMSAAGTIASAGSLVATRATKIREANIHFLPLTNNAPPVVNFVDANMKAWGFNGATQVQDLFSSIDMQHDYIAGTDLDLHIHWAPSTGTGGNVKWQFYVQWAEMSGTWAAATLYTTTVAAGSTAWVSGVASVTIPGTGHTYNSRLMIRLVRDPTDAADTYADPACVTAIGCHYSTDIGQ